MEHNKILLEEIKEQVAKENFWTNSLNLLQESFLQIVCQRYAEQVYQTPFLGWTKDKDVLNQQREYWGAMNGIKALKQQLEEKDKESENRDDYDKKRDGAIRSMIAGLKTKLKDQETQTEFWKEKAKYAAEKLTVLESKNKTSTS